MLKNIYGISTDWESEYRLRCRTSQTSQTGQTSLTGLTHFSNMKFEKIGHEGVSVKNILLILRNNGIIVQNLTALPSGFANALPWHGVR